MTFTRLIRLSVLLALGLACADSTGPIPLSTPDSLAFISDGAHGGTAGFYFLPPMVRNPGSTGDFDGTLSPVVDILCVSAGCANADHAMFAMGDGGPTGAVQLDAADEHYMVSWNSRATGAVAGETYRVRIRVGDVVLGYADIVAAANARGGKPVLVAGQTLVVRFRIERDIAAQLAVSPEQATIDVGDTQAFAATWLDLHGQPTLGPPVSWSSTDESVATVDADGVASGLAGGTTVIEATAGDHSASASLDVSAPPVSTGLSPGDVTTVASVDGWSVRCLEWDGRTCVRPQLSVDCGTCGEYAECGEWHDLTNQDSNGLALNRGPRHFCVIATGSPDLSAVGNGASPVGPYACGAGGSHPTCTADSASLHLAESGLTATHGIRTNAACEPAARLTVDCTAW